MPQRERLAALVLALPGVVAPLLPFTGSLSPLKAIVDFPGLVGLLAAPAFLAMPIAA